MASSAEQRALIAQRLPLGRVDDSAEQRLEIALTRRQLRFVLEAIGRYRDEQCEMDNVNPECDLMYWYEGSQGQLERRCDHFCEHLIDGLLAQIPEKK